MPTPVLPLQLLLGGEDGYRLQLDPEMVVDADGRFHPNGDYLVFDPVTFYSTISGFVRLSEGESLTLGRDDPLQRLLLQYPDEVDARHLRLKLTGKGLALRKKSSTHGACVTPLTEMSIAERVVHWRTAKIQRLAKVINAPIDSLPRDEALALAGAGDRGHGV